MRRDASHLFVLLALSASCSPTGPRDIAVDSPHVVAEAGAPQEPANETYVYVARRPHGVVGLAEARGMSDEDAHAIVDRVADAMEACARTLDAQGALVEGAARVVAVADASGTPAVNLKHAPGDAVAQNALMCLVAPVRSTPFPKNAGFAIEATWEPSRGAAAADAGG